MTAMPALVSNMGNLSSVSKAMFALTLIWSGDTSNAMAAALAKSWYDDIRVQGQTAYITDAQDGGSPQSAGLDVNALVLRIFTEGDFGFKEDPLVEKVANYVASGGEYESTLTLVYASLALASYDRMHHSAQPQLVVDVRTEPRHTAILSGNITNVSQLPLTANFPYANLTQPSSISFDTHGEGLCSFNLDIQFIPKYTYSVPVYHGLLVEKRISVLDSITVRVLALLVPTTTTTTNTNTHARTHARTQSSLYLLCGILLLEA